LAIFRGGRLVWNGPVVNVRGDADQTVIIARDLFALMNQRLLHVNHCYDPGCNLPDGTPGSIADLTVIGKALVEDAFATDGHGYQIEVVSLAPGVNGGIGGSRLYIAGENAWTDAMQEALRLGLDATWLGKKLILGSVPWGRTQTLVSDDFQSLLEYEIDGLAFSTRVVTIGDGVVGVGKADGTDVNGEDRFFGLLESVSKDHIEFDTVAQADSGAKAIVDAQYPMPVTLSTPTGNQLAITAPVTIEELVPGVLIPVIATGVCRNSLSGSFILLELEVTVTADGEAVAITLGSIQAANSGEQ
jgi:hypothetical protein